MLEETDDMYLGIIKIQSLIRAVKYDELLMCAYEGCLLTHSLPRPPKQKKYYDRTRHSGVSFTRKSASQQKKCVIKKYLLDPAKL